MYIPLWVWRGCAFPCAPFTIPSFIKKIITQLSPGGLADADWLFKLLPLYWSSVWKDSNRFILPKAKCFVLDEFLRAECKRWQKKEAFLGGNYAWINVVVWKILGSEGLRALVEWEWSAVCFPSCPQLANIWWGRGGPLPHGSQSFIKLDDKLQAHLFGELCIDESLDPGVCILKRW